MTAPLLLSLAILGITLLGWTSQWFWPSWIMDLTSSFQVQYAIANFLLWLLLLGHSLKPRHSTSNSHRKSAYAGLILGLACITFQASLLGTWYRPTTRMATAAPSELRTVKVLSSNMYPGNEDYAPLLNLIEQERPDLVLLQEATALSLEKLGTLQDLLPHHLHKVPPGDRKPGQKYPPKGTAIFSRFPLELQTAEANSPFDRAGISARIQTGPSNSGASAEFQVYAVHALVPIRPNFYRQRNDQLAAVFNAANEVDVPAIAMGDFNTAIWSPVLAPSKTQRLTPIRQGFGIVPTWRPSVFFPKGLQWLSRPFSIPIDHCYISPEIIVQDFRTGLNVKSDHLPIIVELQIPTAPIHSKSAMSPKASPHSSLSSSS